MTSSRKVLLVLTILLTSAVCFAGFNFKGIEENKAFIEKFKDETGLNTKAPRAEFWLNGIHGALVVFETKDNGDCEVRLCETFPGGSIEIKYATMKAITKWLNAIYGD